MTWNGQRVLITGAGGFIGSHLAETLVEAGADVRAFVRYTSLRNTGWLEKSPHRNAMQIIFGDIVDQDCVESAMIGVDVVFHLAALIGIPYSYVAPDSYVRTNIEGTLNVLRAACRLQTGRIIHTSTSEVYGTARYVPINEVHPLQGQSPYSATKIAADKLVESYHLSFGLTATTVRPFNTYGPRQSARAVIPTIISQALANKPIRLGATSPTRDFTYVEDTVAGFLHAAQSSQAIGQTLNLGVGAEISVGDLARRILNLMKCEALIEADDDRKRPEASEVERLLSDNTKMSDLTGWKPRVSLDEGLRRTIDWIAQNKQWFPTDRYVV